MIPGTQDELTCDPSKLEAALGGYRDTAADEAAHLGLLIGKWIECPRCGGVGDMGDRDTGPIECSKCHGMRKLWVPPE